MAQKPQRNHEETTTTSARPVWKQWAWAGIILLVAAVLRQTGLNWDGYHHYHPDERYISWVATTIEWPADWAQALDPHNSTFNPYYWPPEAASEGIEVLQDESRRFAYGHVPLYLGVAATRLVERLSPALIPYLPDTLFLTTLVTDILNSVERVEFNHLTAVARALTALVDTGTVLLVFLLGRRLYNPTVGLLAAAFLALNVMHIQLAHFFTSDPYLTFFVTAALLFIVYSSPCTIHNSQFTINHSPLTIPPSPSAPPLPCSPAPASRWQSLSLLLAAICTGLAIGSKFNAILLLLPLGWAAWSHAPQSRRLWWLVATFGVTLLTFMLANPFTWLDWTCQVISPPLTVAFLQLPALDWSSCYLENILAQGGMVGGRSALAFTYQYEGTSPYLYFIEMQLRWGMGPLLGIIAFTGLIWETWRAGRRFFEGRKQKVKSESQNFILHPSSFILLFWVFPYFLITGTFYVKFMRYMQPITPFLMLYGAAWLLHVLRSTRSLWRNVIVAAVLLAIGAYTLAFLNIYNQAHPWDAAARWIYRHVPAGTVILSEQWDDYIPATMVVDGTLRRREEYPNQELTWLTGSGERDNEAKLKSNLERLASAEYVTILSNRVYGVAPRLPSYYPLSSRYHQLLFDGSLGYELVWVGGRYPNLFGWSLKPDSFIWPGLDPPPLVEGMLAALPGINGGRADESFTVYDQPLTMVFRNTGDLTADEMREFFNTPIE